ncbi:hypothetical protein [Algoriphagus algorifonticola]|uniref:hypothetical protein n=1 Tax=Algoriphagus algorifonticola TaxID=2593007 RepID=UPI0011A79941|nr:hypothetical protein [Algoriphagus algorifonticola]
MKVRFLLVILLVISTAFIQKVERDPRLVGKWTMLFSKDVNGKIIKDEFYGKSYVETFTKDGKWIIDPQFFRDDAKRFGINAPIDYSAIPTFQWKTIDNQILEMNTSVGSQTIRYGFSGDTLIFGYPNGHTRYLLKRK